MFKTKKRGIPKLVRPLFWSVFSICGSIILLAILKLVNRKYALVVFDDFVVFTTGYLPILFMAMLFINYAKLFWGYKKTVAVFAPMLSSISALISIKYIFSLAILLNIHFNLAFLNSAANMILSNIFLILMLFLVFGYSAYFVRLIKALSKQKV